MMTFTLTYNSILSMNYFDGVLWCPTNPFVCSFWHFEAMLKWCTNFYSSTLTCMSASFQEMAMLTPGTFFHLLHQHININKLYLVILEWMLTLTFLKPSMYIQSLHNIISQSHHKIKPWGNTYSIVAGHTIKLNGIIIETYHCNRNQLCDTHGP